MSGRGGWVCRMVAGCVLACAVAAARADDAAPAERAAVEEAGRLLRAGMQVLRAAVPDAAAKEPDAAEAQEGRKARQNAAEKQRQQQIDQQAQQMQQFFKPALAAELELVRSTCGSLPADARKQIVAAGNEAVKAAARQFAVHQFGDGRRRQGFEPRQAIHDAVAAAVKPHAAADEFAAYEREQVARVARRARAARILIVNKLDSELDLAAAQREQIAADLEKNWQAGWLRELDDNGGMMINNFRPAPDFADKSITPHLDDRQKAEWKKWCQQAGWSRMGHHVNWNFDGQSLQPDPWWSK